MPLLGVLSDWMSAWPKGWPNVKMTWCSTIFGHQMPLPGGVYLTQCHPDWKDNQMSRWPDIVLLLATRCLYCRGTSDLSAKRTSKNLNSLWVYALLHRSFLQRTNNRAQISKKLFHECHNMYEMQLGHMWPIISHCWSFVEKTSVKQDLKHKSVFKFSEVLFALKSDGPPTVQVLGQVDIFVRSWAQANL